MLPKYSRRAKHLLSAEACAEDVNSLTVHREADVITRGTSGISEPRKAREGVEKGKKDCFTRAEQTTLRRMVYTLIEARRKLNGKCL